MMISYNSLSNTGFCSRKAVHFRHQNIHQRIYANNNKSFTRNSFIKRVDIHNDDSIDPIFLRRGTMKPARRPIMSSSDQIDLPSQGQSAVAGLDPIDVINKQLQEILNPSNKEDYLAVSVLELY